MTSVWLSIAGVILIAALLAIPLGVRKLRRQWRALHEDEAERLRRLLEGR
jgi:hypothetical protein